MTTDLKKLAEIKRYAPYGMLLSSHDGPPMFESIHGGYFDVDDITPIVITLHQEVETLRQQNKSLAYDLFHATAHNGYARQEALEEAAKECDAKAFRLTCRMQPGGDGAPDYGRIMHNEIARQQSKLCSDLATSIRALQQHTGEVPGCIYYGIVSSNGRLFLDAKPCVSDSVDDLANDLADRQYHEPEKGWHVARVRIAEDGETKP